MFLDPATIQDLELVPAPAVRGTTLWSLINRTRWRVGADALRQRLLDPPHTVEAIRELQRAHQTMGRDARDYRMALDTADADAVEGYLNLPWQLPQDMPPAARFRKWYRQYLQEVERGRPSVTSLLDAAADLHRRVAQTNVSILCEIGDRIAGLLDEAPMRQLRSLTLRRRSTAIRQFDQLARGTAKPILTRLLRAVGELEALWSVGAATAEHGWTYPHPSTRFHVTGLFHPGLGQHAVANDLDLDPRVRVCFVTGPNMAGKSTFLKATAWAVLMAHAGSGVAAQSMEFVPVGALFSSVQIADNLSTGESFYLAEVRRIGALATVLADHGSAVAVVDEPFRGTNVHDAAEATLAVITRLAAHPSALVLVASHVGEIGPALCSDPRVALLHFSADVTGDRPRFDFTLRDGVSDQRLGMTLLRQEGVLDRLSPSQSFDNELLANSSKLS
jgi:DNA mismatch repair protein MutS